jgi:hypothetical protein
MRYRVYTITGVLIVTNIFIVCCSLQGHSKPYYSVSQGKMVHGVQIHLTDIRKEPLSLIQFYILQEAHKLWPGKDWTVDSIIDLWTKDIPAFRNKVQRYLLD